MQIFIIGIFNIYIFRYLHQAGDFVWAELQTKQNKAHDTFAIKYEPSLTSSKAVNWSVHICAFYGIYTLIQGQQPS